MVNWLHFDYNGLEETKNVLIHSFSWSMSGRSFYFDRLRGHFRDLHPQFEVLDWRGVSYFCNFAFITSHLKLIIEIKGLDTYASGMDRQTFCNELNRETFLSAMGYQVISFAYEDVANRPEICIMLLRIVISRYHAATSSVGVTTGYGA